MYRKRYKYEFNFYIVIKGGNVMDIEFKKACKEDIKNIIEVQSKSFYEDYVKYGECPTYNEPEQKILDFINGDKETVYKILKDGEIVGDIIIRKIEDHKYYLRTICVIPECQSLGIGQKALSFIEKEHPEVNEWELITPFKSFRNHHVYEKMGYVKVEEFKQSDVLTMFRYRKHIDCL